jgi:DNA-binding winged helix-turn-helix (wHTH) protein/tetratricopeptide (TPR) repeat protein
MSNDCSMRFAAYTLAGPNGPLLDGDRVVHLPPKALAVLWLLATHAGEVVTKERLFATVWADTTVGDEVLTSCLRTLRRALGDDALRPRYVATVHRLGYRFVAPTRTGSAPTPLAAAEPRARERGASGIVGRDDELRRLHALFARAAAGERQIAFVTGEAGIGKTALVDTFRAELDAAEAVGGQCVEQYGAAEAYLPVLEALGRLCRRPGGARALAVLERYAPSWLLQMPALVPAPALAALRERSADVTRDRMLREMTEALEALTEDAPLVLVLEDLHWSDASTIELLSAVARRREPARLMVIGTYRSVELIVKDHPLKTVKHELVAHGRCTEIALPHLGPDAVRAYVDGRGGLDADDDVAAFVYRRTEGHPLFMVHVAAYLEAHEHAPLALEPGGALDSAVPLGLRELIEAQAARLREDERRLLEAASVVGVEFSVASVAAALDTSAAAIEEPCEHLSAAGQFLEGRGVEPLPDGTLTGRFGFRHALYREVLYRHVPELRRARMHRAVGTHLERAYGRRATEIATELAAHFEHGHDPARAIDYATRAGEAAVGRGAHHEAAHCLTAALRLLAETPATPERDRRELPLQLGLGTALRSIKGYAALETAAAFQRAAALCRGSEHARELFDAMTGLVTFQQVSGQLRAAREHLEGQMRIAERLGDADRLMIVHSQMGDVLFWLGDLAEGRRHLERTATLYDEARTHGLASPEAGDLNVNVLSYLSWTDWYLGYADRAAETSERALGCARELAHPHTLAFALYFAARLRELRVDVEAQRRHVDELTALVTAHRFPIYGALALQSRGWALMQQDAALEGIPRMREALDAYATTGARLGRRHQHYLLAELHSRAGNVEDSERVAAEGDALRAGGIDEEECYAADCLRIRGELILRAYDHPTTRDRHRAARRMHGDATGAAHSEAEACFQRAVDVARRQHAKSLELRAATSLARLWGRQGKEREARQMLAAVYGWFTEGFETAPLREASSLLDQLR